MKHWLKIEAILNKILLTIMSALSAVFNKIIPSNIKKPFKKAHDKGVTYKNTITSEVSTKINKVKSTTQEITNKGKETLTKSQDSVKKSVNKIKTIDWKKIDYSKAFVFIVALIAPFFTKIKGWVISLKPGTIITVTITSMAISLTGITVYTQSQKIKEKSEDGEVREPASYSDTMDRNAWTRSKYRHHAQKVLKLSDVSIPIYFENDRGMQTVKIDFSFVANNRYIAQYFTIYENEFVLRDRLNKKLQPIIPSFPMQPEGKKILKAKIIEEINILIKDLKIKGEVKDIYIHSILNG